MWITPNRNSFDRYDKDKTKIKTHYCEINTCYSRIPHFVQNLKRIINKLLTIKVRLKKKMS